jgi:predicted enzyme related to lactoylglutathione lyase
MKIAQNKAFGRSQSFVAGPPKNGLQFMVKDSRKYASIGGWRFARDDGKPADAAVHKTCFACHQAVQRAILSSPVSTMSASNELQHLEQREGTANMNMKLEEVLVPDSDVDRAKAFYEKLGLRLDGDFVVNEKFRVLQFTPPRSRASIIFGKGVTSAKAGSAELVLAVDDIDAARADLLARGARTAGCSRRSRRGVPAANGSRSEHKPRTLRPLPSSSAKLPSTTTITRRRIRGTTGGTGTLPT